MAELVTIIPCRLDSKRYPRKLIEHKVNGKPLIQHIFELSAAQRDTYITCSSKDAGEFLKYVPESNIILSGGNHINGTSRVREAALKLGLDDNDIVINLQGDNLGIPKIKTEKFRDILHIPYTNATIYSYYYNGEELTNDTKCLMNNREYALWFTRKDVKVRDVAYDYHIGCYVYSMRTLLDLPIKETVESLEQNAWLLAGWKVKMILNEKILSVDFPS